jgi:hypothetical protein
MRRNLIRLRPYLIAAFVGTILVVDLSNQWEVPIAQLPGELHDRIAGLEADAHPETLLKLANEGNAHAQYIYALRHTSYAPSKLQIKVDSGIAFNWIKRAAEGRHSRAMAVLALYHLKGLGTPKNLDEAKKWAAQAAAKSQPMGYRVLGDIAKAEAEAMVILKTDPDYKQRQADRAALINEACVQYQRGANSGDRSSLRALGECFEKGLPGMPQNYRLALEYYTRAASRRDTESISILADRYENGEKAPRDLPQSYAWRLVLIELKEEEKDRESLKNLENQMTLAEVQAGQELAIKLIKDMPSDASDALARLNPAR